MVDLETFITNLHIFLGVAAVMVVKAGGVSFADDSGNPIRWGYLLTLKIAKMWKYRKRWKFRFPSALGTTMFNFILVSKHIHIKGNLKTGKWNIHTFIMENCFKARWHIPTVPPYLHDVFMRSRKGIISMITFSWNHRGLSVQAMNRQHNEASHLTAGRFRSLACTKVHDVSMFSISQCFNASCNVLVFNERFVLPFG